MPRSSNTSPAKGTILYYPTIAVPPGDWLRQAVFYFDEVASIVPQEVRFGSNSGELLISLSPELALLRAKGVFRAISPEALTDDDGQGENWEAAHRLMDDFQAAIRGDRFQALLAAHPPSSWVRIHEGKLIIASRRCAVASIKPCHRWCAASCLCLSCRAVFGCSRSGPCATGDLLARGSGRVMSH